MFRCEYLTVEQVVLDGGLDIKEGQQHTALLIPDSGAELPGFIF